MARNQRGSTQRSDIFAHSTVHPASYGRQLGSEPYIPEPTDRGSILQSLHARRNRHSSAQFIRELVVSSSSKHAQNATCGGLFRFRPLARLAMVCRAPCNIAVYDHLSFVEEGGHFSVTLTGDYWVSAETYRRLPRPCQPRV